MLLPAMAMGQYITLWHNDKGSSLQFNLDRLWSYNLYEHSRWGGGLQWTSAPRKVDGTRIILDGYLAYGTQDRQWKGGIGNEIMFGRSPHGLTQYITVWRDYQAVGSRQLSSGRYDDPASLSAFMNRRMSDQAGMVWGYRWRVRGTEHSIEGRMTLGGRLFNNERLLYRILGDTLVEEDAFLLRWLMKLPQGITTQIEAGGTLPQYSLVARLLAQYDHSFDIGAFELHTFMQAGITPPSTPYIYMFDLGGTFGAPLYFRNSLLTARPNEFTANTFAFLSLRFGPSNPLCRLWSPLLQMGTYPVPFVALHAAWGHLWGQRDDGRLAWEGFDLQAPHLGIGEAIAGVDGLFRWGLVDWGVAVAYRLTPPQAPYHFTQTQDNLALLVTAALIF